MSQCEVRRTGGPLIRRRVLRVMLSRLRRMVDMPRRLSVLGSMLIISRIVLISLGLFRVELMLRLLKRLTFGRLTVCLRRSRLCV